MSRKSISIPWKNIMSISPKDINEHINNEYLINSLLYSVLNSYQIQAIDSERICHLIQILQQLCIYYNSFVNKEQIVYVNDNERLDNEIENLKKKNNILKSELLGKEKVILSYENIVTELQKKMVSNKVFYTKKIKELEEQLEESEINKKLDNMKLDMSNLINNTYRSYTDSIQNNSYNNICMSTNDNSSAINRYQSKTYRASNNKNIINLNSPELNQSLNQLCNKLDQSINENNKYFSNFTLKLNSMKNRINSQIDYLKTSSNHSVNGPFKYYSSKSVNPIRFKYGTNWASNDDIVNVSTRESDYYLKRLKTAK